MIPVSDEEKAVARGLNLDPDADPETWPLGLVAELVWQRRIRGEEAYERERRKALGLS